VDAAHYMEILDQADFVNGFDDKLGVDGWAFEQDGASTHR
jgi:hypothetical protein